jgi:hypothetical protein
MCHLALVCLYPVSQSADISLCTSRIRSLRLLSHCLRSSFQLQIKQLCNVLASCEPGEMMQLGGGSGYCISAETAGIRCTTHGTLNLLVLVFVYCASLVTYCHCSVSHELHCWLLGGINTELLTVYVGYINASNSVVPISSRGCGTAFCLLSLKFSWVGHSHLAILKVIKPESFHNVFLQFTFL